MKRQKQTDIMKLVKENPEMPKKLELDDNKRKQLAELMLEYPTKEVQENNPEEQIEENASSHAYSAGKHTTP